MQSPLGYAPLLTVGGIVEAYSPERKRRRRVRQTQGITWSPTYRDYDDIYNSQTSPKRQKVARPDTPKSPTYDPGPVLAVETWSADPAAARPSSPTYDPGLVTAPPRPSSPTYDPGLVLTPEAKPFYWKKPSTSIESVAFKVRSAEEIKRLSAVEVKTSLISDENGHAVPNGLRDPRFGPCFGTNTPCGICGATPQKPCAGHVGHLCFAEPLYAVNMVKFVIFWLRRVCPSCGHLHVPATADAERVQQSILNNKHTKKKKCDVCGETLLKSIVWKRDLQTLVVKRDAEEQMMPAREAFEIFNRVPETLSLFLSRQGSQCVAHPKHLISRVVCVPGLCLRPCVGDGSGDGGARGESDLTYRLKQIVVANELYATKVRLRSDPVSLRSALFGLQDLYTQYLDVSKSARGGGSQEQRQPKYKSHACILKGKQGLLRDNCMGKRVDHASRCPIAPFEGSGNFGHPSQVGVPDWLCKKHVVPIRVTDYNRKELRRMIADGLCNFVERDGERIDLSTTADVGRLQVGTDVVYRQLMTGDVVLFNRQPSLSMRSFQGLFAVRLPPVKEGVGSRVFRLPLSQTTPFNADFDGDEMNLHVPQTPEARAEAIELMGAHRNVLSANSGAACIVPVQTARLASFAMTRDDARMTKREWFSCLGHAPDRVLDRVHSEGPPAFPAPARLFWSLCLPPDYSWTSKGVTIVKGYLQSGRVNKSVLASLVHDIAVDLSPMKALDFIHSLTCLSRGYSTMKEPGTINFADMSPEQSLVDACKRLTLEERRKAAKPGADVAACRDRAMRGMMSLVYQKEERNGLSDLILSGAKGSRANKCVMLGFLGPQLSLSDTNQGVFRPPESDPGGSRRCFVTSASANPFDDGFIDNSYSSGMSLQQYSTHAIAGRRGLTSSSRKVGKIGYMYRRCSVVNDGLVVKHGQVVNIGVHPHQIVSFLYGGDGRSPFIAETGNRLKVPCVTPTTQWAHASLVTDVAALVDLFPDALDRDYDVPVSVERILFQAEHRTYSPDESTAETAAQLWEKTKTMAALHGEYYGDYVSLWVRIHLHPHRMVSLPAHAWLWAVGEVDKRLWKARAPNGECVGCHAASSLSAMATQATLNSFHNVGSKGGSFRGLEETVNLVKRRSVRETRFRLRLNPNLGRDERCARTAEWAARRRLVTLRDVVIKREPPVRQAEDAEIMQAYWDFPDEDVSFPPKMRLEVQCNDDHVFDVRLALLRCGVRHASYALREADNTWIFHLSSVLASDHLSARVAGSIRGCKANGDVVVCEEASLEDVFEEILPRTFWTNCFHETRAKLGAEAARRLMVVEMKTMLASFGAKMAPRHIELLADRCTQTGELLGCTRFGVRSRDKDRVFHATFEMPVVVLSEGAVAGKVDHLNGSQERQIVGSTNKTGSYNEWIDLLPDPNPELQPVNPESDSDSDTGGVDDDSWLREWLQKQDAKE